MASPVVGSDFDNASFTGSICDLFRQKLLNNDKMVELLDYLFNPDGTIAPTFATDLMELLQPIGTLLHAPVDLGLDTDAWLKCEGQAINRTTYSRLFAKFGETFGVGDGSTTFNLPDFRDKFAVGASGSKSPSSTGGLESVALSEDELPSHQHALGAEVELRWDVNRVSGGDNASLHPSANLTPDLDIIGGFTEITGSGDAHENLPPYIACVVYCKVNHKINGVIL